MRDHEIELIAALVEGRLDDESEARALIESSPEALDEYEAQRLAFETLTAIEQVTLTEPERAALHRDVWTALRADAAPATKSPWYYRWAPVAAGMFVIVGLVSVLYQSGGGDSGETFAEVAGDLGGAVTSTAAASDGDDATAEPRTETTAAAAEAEGGAPLAGADREVFSNEAENVRRGEIENATMEAYSQADDSEARSCLDEAALSQYVVVATLSDPSDTFEDTSAESTAKRLYVAIPDGAERSTTPVAFVDPDTCQVIHLDR